MIFFTPDFLFISDALNFQKADHAGSNPATIQMSNTAYIGLKIRSKTHVLNSKYVVSTIDSMPPFMVT
jgi:hypothetical protein